MKKSLFIILFLLLVPTVLALEVDLKEEYKLGETLIAEISGDFIDNIGAEDVLFYSGRAYVGLVYDIAKVQDKVYIYALLPIKERNYTMVLKDVHYYDLGVEKTEDLEFDFSVNGELVDFSINPGFIVTDKDFNIKIESYKDQVIKAEFKNTTQNVSVNAYKSKTMSFSVEDIKQFTVTTLNISSENTEYSIPVAVYKFEDVEENITDVETSKGFRFAKSQYNLTALKDSEIVYVIRLTNTGQEDIDDITFDFGDLEDIISIMPEDVNNLEAGELVKINVTILSSDIGTIEGTFEAESDYLTTETIISIETIENQNEFADVELYQGETCAELGGNFCQGDEECDGNYELSADFEDKLCCIGVCEGGGADSTRTIILIVVIILIGVIGFFTYRKLKLKKKTSKDLLEEKGKKFEERFKPKEIKDSLER